tara:strand:- start:453 stop:986 length:534 start_codon:yes stop_codon:yes gene_type:complete
VHASASPSVEDESIYIKQKDRDRSFSSPYSSTLLEAVVVDQLHEWEALKEIKEKKKPTAKKTPAITAGLEPLMKTKIKEIYGEVRMKSWGVKERTLAKKMILNYGRELTEEVIKTFVDSWPEMVNTSRGRLRGLPTINFLWSAQDRFFGEAQITHPVATAPSRTDEYVEIEDTDNDW